MLSTKLLPNIGRTRATFISKCIPFTTPTTTSLTLDSYRETSFQSNVYARNRVIDNQIKSGSLNTALKLFDEMPIRDVVTWNLVISGCGRYGHPSQALCLYNQMISQGIKESGSTLSNRFEYMLRRGVV